MVGIMLMVCLGILHWYVLLVCGEGDVLIGGYRVFKDWRFGMDVLLMLVSRSRLVDILTTCVLWLYRVIY